MHEIFFGVADDCGAASHFGAARLQQGLAQLGYRLRDDGDSPWTLAQYRQGARHLIYLGTRKSDFIQELEAAEVLLYLKEPPQGDGYAVVAVAGGLTVIVGDSDRGVLYGCLALNDWFAEAKRWPPLHTRREDAPALRWRGPVLGLQKPEIEPPRQNYEYPVTPERFPWFYDKSHWLTFMEDLLRWRANAIYLWSGHPFSSFVRLPEFPEALEVSETTLVENQAMLTWIMTQAQCRGIQIIFHFYNIHIPLPFAEHHGLALHQRMPTPLTQRYTKAALAEFIRRYAGMGLMVCLGENLNGDLYGQEWFMDTVLPGIEAGLGREARSEDPPIIIRAHGADAGQVVMAAKPRYPNLYTEAKYNGESLTTTTPRGRWQTIHRRLSAMGGHIVNVHQLANLEPFRFAAPSFIQQSVQAARFRLGASGLHLYPLCYWDWPYAPDAASPRLSQPERDWMWYQAWFRYAWNADRDVKAEFLYWADALAERFGSHDAGAAILQAMEAIGQCAPIMLSWFGITEGNRQTWSLGMTMGQLTHPDRYVAWPDLWECQAPAGERLERFVERSVQRQAHVGETPPEVLDFVMDQVETAERAIFRAKAMVTVKVEEFDRIASDVAALCLLHRFYVKKIQAALLVLRYKYQAEGRYREHAVMLEPAVELVGESLAHYRQLTALTEKTYRYANSMQTPMRKIPFADGKQFRHWRDCLPRYEEEWQRFSTNVRALTQGDWPASWSKLAERTPWRGGAFILHSKDAETFTVHPGQSLFSNGTATLTKVAQELHGLTGIRFNQAEAERQGKSLELEFRAAAVVLIGYFTAQEGAWLKPPRLEEDGHADDRGGAAPILTHAVQAFAYPSVNVHGFRYPPGRHHLILGRGAYVCLGVVDGEQQLIGRTVDANDSDRESLDWLFEGG